MNTNTASTYLIRYASDMPYSVGMVLADELGNQATVTATTTRVVVLSGFHGGYSHAFVRQHYPYLVGTLTPVEEPLGWDEIEGAEIEDMAQRAQWEDDLRTEIEVRAAAEHARKNPKPALPPIKTWHAFPPIPVRSMDWAAMRDGDEEQGLYGWGPTEAEAIADLLDREAEA